MKYQICKSFDFSYAHRLPNHDGKCANHHGHNGKLDIVLESNGLIDSGPKIGMVMDFGDLSKLVEPYIEKYLDHRYLNDNWINPTAETICWYIRGYLIDKMPKGVSLIQVRVWETPTSYAEIVEEAGSISVS